MSNTFDTERLARLLRVSRDQELAPSTRGAIRDLLLSELGASAAVAAPMPALTASGRGGGRAGGRAEPDLARVEDAATPEQLELKIRQMAQADATWTELAPLAYELLAKRRTPQMAARLAELAFLHGSGEETVGAFSRLRVLAGDEFHRDMHPAVRAHLTVRLWREGREAELVSLLFKERELDSLVPIERLCLFRAMAQGEDTAGAFIFFRKHQKCLMEAVTEYGPHVGISLAGFLLQTGRLALGLGYDAEARALLERIPDEAAERGEALRVLLDATIESGRAGSCDYVQLLVSEASAAGRLKLFAEFFATTRGLGGFRDLSRPAFNDILGSPGEWLAPEPEVWATFSELLVSHSDLEPLLPHIFEFFRQNALSFHGPLLDAALWQGPMAVKAGSPRDRFWHGVACLHHYVNSGPGAEVFLWQARETIQDARAGMATPLPLSWRELHKAAYAWVTRNHYLMEADRVRMLEQLRVAVDDAAVATSDVEEYLEHASKPPISVLASLADIAEAKKAPHLVAKILLKRAEATHLTNGDLSRLWRIANERRDADLAWRIATVLQARKALVATVRPSWEISGEKRAHYPLAVPDKAILERCLKDFPLATARLGYALAQVGPLLPELLAMLDAKASVAKLSAPPSDSVEAKVEKALQALPWLPSARKRYRFGQDPVAFGTDLPAFMQVLPGNEWSVLAARLSERLGLNAFGYRLSRLRVQIEELIPRLASRQDLRHHSSRVAKWLRDLTPEQRNAWQDLASLARSMEDEEAADGLAALVCRLALIMMPNHLMALTSLQAMRAPVRLIWNLETFLLGDTYSQIRARLGVRSRVLVPNALQRLSDVHVSECR